jgi:hypothetical protein
MNRQPRRKIMTDKNQEPIDLSKRRADKLLDQERRKAAQEAGSQPEWSGAVFAAQVESIEISEEVLKGVKTFMCTIAGRVKEARSIREVERPCFGLALLLLRDYDREAFDKLLEMIRDGLEGKL